MSRQSRKGSAWEVACEGYLREFFEDTEGTIHVERKHGAKDQGDIHGLFSRGRAITVECKNHAEYRFGDWIAEAEAEAANAGAEFGVVFAKRKGRGLSNMGQHWAVMSIETFCRLIDAPTDMARVWGGPGLREKVERYAREIGRPVDEVLLSLLGSALRDMGDT